MTEWLVKDLSKLTGVSVQTLHHYDRIELLRPSARLANGYRVYSEKDLLKLQHIIALKYFGFGLSQIKVLLEGEVDMRDHFALQAQFLHEKANTMLAASKTLHRIMDDCSNSKAIPWETIIHLIEVFRMTQELEHAWVKNVLSPAELQQFAQFEAGLKTRFSEQDSQAFEKAWKEVVADVKSHLKVDPKSEVGIKLGQRSMDLVNLLYGKEHANLKRSIWEKGFKQGVMDENNFIDPEVIAWLDKAIAAYYRSRIYSILDQVEVNATPELLMHWQELMEEKYGFGDAQGNKKALIEMLMQENRVGPVAKKWLAQIV